MASGTLGQSSLAATTNTTVYTVPAAKIATFNLSVCNRSSTQATIRLAVAASGTPADAEYIEYDTVLEGNGVIERTGIVASATKNLVAFASTANVSVNVYGYEE
jgi:hypothetical protein